MDNFSTDKTRVIYWGVISFLALCFFSIGFSVIPNPGVDLSKDRKTGLVYDELSGELFQPESAFNYRDANPYGSFFVGEDILLDAGVTSLDSQVVQDVLINFVMYEREEYNAKISFVKDSFKVISRDGFIRTFSVGYGINDKDRHTIVVTSDWLNNSLRVRILEPSGREIFSRSFTSSDR